MDIECSELPWIKSLNENQMNKLEQIVIVFHFPFSDNEIDVYSINCCGVRLHKDVIIHNFRIRFKFK